MSFGTRPIVAREAATDTAEGQDAQSYDPSDFALRRVSPYG